MLIPGLEIDFDSDVPVYRQIAEGVRAAAADGRLESGHRLPPTRDLARQLGVNRNTVVAAYEALANDGLVSSQTGRGTFLKPSPDLQGAPEGTSEDATWFTGFSRAADSAASGGLQSIYRLVVTAEGISFVGSYPTLELLPIDDFRRAMDDALRIDGASLLAYGPTAGYTPLRETIAEAMTGHGSPVTAGDLLITNGAQQALELVFRTFVDRGDAVIAEEPSYTGALSALATLGARVVGVPLDDEGIRTDLLEVALQRDRPRLIYVQPTFQNPTARVMSEQRRRELLALARRYRCPVIEDDWAGDLRFEGQPLPTLHALDEGRQVIYLSTFSKKLMPGLRVGWVAAPAVVLERLVELKRVEDCGTSTLLQAALDRFLRQGGLDEHLARVRPAYRDRRDVMLDALQRWFPEQARWVRPQGGLFVWVSLPAGFDGDGLFNAARQHGVQYSRGDWFHSDASGRNTLRLTFSAVRPEKIRQGIRVLGELIRERLDRATPGGQESIEAMPIL